MKNKVCFDFTMKPLEIVLLVLILMYLFSYAPTPRFISSVLDTPLGIVFLFVVVLFLFLYCNILLGILFIFVAYKLISSSTPSENTAVISVTARRAGADAASLSLETAAAAAAAPPNAAEDVRFKQYGYQPLKEFRTIPLESQGNLEVSAVKVMVDTHPAAQDYLDTPFKPVMEKVHGASRT